MAATAAATVIAKRTTAMIQLRFRAFIIAVKPEKTANRANGIAINSELFMEESSNIVW
jgi:hypothetical protein